MGLGGFLLFSLLLADGFSGIFDSLLLGLIRVLWRVLLGLRWLLNWLSFSLLWSSWSSLCGSWISWSSGGSTSSSWSSCSSWLLIELNKSLKWTGPLLLLLVWGSLSHQVSIGSLSNLEHMGIGLSGSFIIGSLDFSDFILLKSLLGGNNLGGSRNVLLENLS